VRWSLWILVVFAALLGLFALQLSRPKNDEVESKMIGQPVPQFALDPAVPERPGLSSADLADGKAHLLNIFASWCIPCAAEAPQLAVLERQGAPIVAVAIRDRPEDLEAFFARYGNPFIRVGKDDLSRVQFLIGSSGVPETFVIDGKGVIRHQHIGEIRPEDVPDLMARLKEARG
jgi:cytochrome c biogenesis protein CcmG/thiol:disulfide interchange protein DsbE